jgi:6-phosphogluconolactonase (cycloisomerase 2 family)
MNLRSTFGQTVSTLSLLLLAACGGGGGDSGTTTPSTFTISGTATGLDSGKQVTLVDNGTDSLVVNANGAFTFATSVALNGSYAVTVGTQPTGQTCTVSGDSGTGVTANVSSIALTCSDVTLTVGGTVSGLTTGQHVVLANNGANALTVSANGAYTFTTPVAFNAGYAVTVGTQPTGETCTVSGGTGAGVTANVTTANIVCSATTFTVGGTVTGLTTGQQVTLANNGGDSLTVSANGAYTFHTPVAFNGSYVVTVGTKPTGDTCTVSGGTGAGVTGNITNANIVCSTNTFTIGGTVTGLATGQQVTLADNGGDSLVVNANGAYTFHTPVAFSGNAIVTVGTQPTGQTCSVTGGMNSGVTANVTTANVTCSANTFTVGGTVSGLAAGQQVTLANNGGDSLIVTANAPYTFLTHVAFSGDSTVTVGTQPTGQTCTVTGGVNTGITANVTAANVSCSTNTFTVAGTVTGLTSGQVTLTNNGGDALIVPANASSFQFLTPVVFNAPAIVVAGTPSTAGLACTVTNGTTAHVTTNVTNVSIACSPITFAVNFTVSGLTAGQQVTMLNSGGNAQIISANGNAWSFTVPVSYGGSYAVTVGTQPTAEGCRVFASSGTNVTASVPTVDVHCRPEVSYVANYNANTISQYSIGADGSLNPLTPNSTVATGTTPKSIAVDPLGQYAYVANYNVAGPGTLSQYNIADADGSLTPMTIPTVAVGSTALGVPGSAPNIVAVDPSGRYVYVAAVSDSAVYQYTIGANGALTPMGTASVSTGAGTGPLYMTIDPSGRYLYTGNFYDTNSTVSQFSISPTDGSLAPIGTGSVNLPAGVQAFGITIDAAGQNAYIGDYGTYAQINGGLGAPATNGALLQYTIGSDGSLTPTIGATPFATGMGPWPLVFTPSGQFGFFATNGDNGLWACSIGAGASLNCSTYGMTTTGSLPEMVSVDPSGRYLYVPNQGDGTVSQFSIDTSMGFPGLGNIAAPVVSGTSPTFVKTIR